MMGIAETVAVTSHLLNIEAEIDTGHRLLASAVEMIQPPLDALDETVIEALHTLLRICYWGGRPELWAPLDAAFGRLSPAPPELLDLLRATYRDPARDAVAAVSRIDAAIDRLPAVTDPVVVTRVAMCAVYLDRLSACREPLQRVATEARASGAIASAIQAVFLLGNLSWVNGDWSELEGYVAEGLDLCRDNGYELLAWRGGYVEGLRLAACGETASVRELTDRMTRWAGPRRVSLIQSFADHILALDANGRGDFEAAFHHAAKISPPGELAECRPTALTTVFELTEAAVRTGRRAEAVRHVEAAREASLPALSTRLNLLTTGAAALCADASEASTLFEDALGEPGSTSWPFDRARIQLAYGERLRRDKNTTDARLHLSAALDTFRRLGAEPWAARASQELRATGVSVGNPQPSKATELTPQQYEIATLAAQGLTNRQIGERLYLSPRTVSTHLYQLFPKLGVTSRAALADALRGVSTHETS
jgi:DNA-binding CsgD family transcriptional regulator